MKIKRLIACLLAAAMVMTFVVAPDTHDHDHGYVHAVEETEENVPTITVGTVVANPGEETVIPITVENNPGFAAISIRVYFDTDVVAVDKGYNGSTPDEEDGVYAEYTDFTSSRSGRHPVRMSWEALSIDDGEADYEDVMGDGIAGCIQFTVNEDAAPGRYEVYIDPNTFEAYTISISYDETYDEYSSEILDINFTLVVGAVIVPCAEHTWTAGETNATCTEAGETTYICDVCTMEEVRPEAALGHDYVDYTANGDATCTADGTKTGHCSRCDEPDTVTDEGSKLPHVFTNYVSNGDAVCGVDGTKTAQCDYGCGTTDTVADDGTALEHSFTNYVYNNDAKCGADGSETAECDHGCGQTHTRTAVGTALEHSFTNYVSDNNATCEEDGTKTAQCDYGCGATDTIPDEGSKESAEHSFPAEYTSDGNATCTADGTKSRVCTACGEKETVTDEGSALGHSFVSYVSDENAKCGVDGTETAKCDRCEATDTVADEGSALEHSFVSYVSDGNATCTEDGTKTAVCDHGCGETDTVTDEGSALGHSFVNYVSDGNAACEEDGTKTAKCDHCEATDTVADQGSALGHKFDEKTTDHLATAADCTHKAAYYYTCSNPGCDQVGTETFEYGEFDMNNHMGNEVVVGAKAATEEEEGYTGDIICDACETVLEYGEPIKKLDHVHVMEKTDGNAATCTEAGNIEYWTCSKCHSIFSDAEGIREITEEDTVIDALGHAFTNYVSNNDAACDENGTETAQCDRCEETDTREDADSALGHSFVNYVYNNDATCEEDGTETAQCERCDETDTRTAEGTALGHTADDPVIENEVEPTCTADGGHDEVVYCTVCEKELSRNHVVEEALGHSFTEYIYNEDAACEADGTETAMCDHGCGETDTRTAEGTALGHGDMVHTEAKDASCDEAGNVEYWTCSVCGKHYADPEGTVEIPAEETEVPALGHTWGEWVVTDEPDCTTAGSQTRKCGVCEDEETEEIPALGHDYESVVTKPTTEAGGYTTHTCKVCGHSYVDSYTSKLDPENPPTGDEFQFVGMTALMLASLTGMVVLFLNEKKRNRR